MRRVEELTILSEEERRMLAEVKQAILRHEPGAEVILYGSAARGEREPESDYDVLVLLPALPSREVEDRVRIAAYDAAFDYDFAVSVMVCGREEWDSPLRAATPYHANVEREGVRV